MMLSVALEAADGNRAGEYSGLGEGHRNPKNLRAARFLGCSVKIKKTFYFLA